MMARKQSPIVQHYLSKASVSPCLPRGHIGCTSVGAALLASGASGRCGSNRSSRCGGCFVRQGWCAQGRLLAKHNSEQGGH